MVETVSVLTLIVALINFGWSLYNFRSIEDIKSRMDRERFCRYPDTDVRDILIDYELEKAKKLDKAIHDVEDELEKQKH
tara:strand:- start:650 stop:886 length:237 start_codon:yes stop_codon:yes gene_type:complete